MDINKSVAGKIGVFNAMIASGPVIIQKRDGIEKVLLVKHGDRQLSELKWKFCGGKVIKDTDLEANAIREAQEEVGVNVRLIRPLKPMVIWSEAPETGDAQPDAIILIHYLAAISDEPAKGRQTLDMKWFDINDLPADCSANIRPVIEEYKRIQ